MKTAGNTVNEIVPDGQLGTASHHALLTTGTAIVDGARKLVGFGALVSSGHRNDG